MQAVLDAPIRSFLLTSLLLSLILGVVLWMAGMVTPAARDGRSCAPAVLGVVVLILALFLIG